jgi:hypothetical protein
MTLSDLIAEFRREADDRVTPYLWSREDLTAYANDGEREAARSALLLLDSSSSVPCSYAVSAGDGIIALDSRVLRITRARLASVAAPLAIVSTRTLDMQRPAWESETGVPRILIPDWQTGVARLAPIPDADDALHLSVFRLPLDDMKDAGDEPEIHVEHHPALVHWMLYRGYIRPDTDTFSAQASATHLAAFRERFGPAPTQSDRMRRESDRTRYEEAK